MGPRWLSSFEVPAQPHQNMKQPMAFTKNPGEPRPLIRALALIFLILRVVLMPLIYALTIPSLISKGSSMHPLSLLLILGTTTATLTSLLSLLAPISFAGLWLEKLKCTREFASVFRYCFYWLIRAYGKVFHGYRIYGLQHLTEARAGFIAFYHIQMPLDIMYLTADMYLETGRIIGGVAHRDLMGSWNFLLRYMKYTCSRGKLEKAVIAGHLCAVAPGGERETVFSRNYEIDWSRRIGFAKMAKELGVPVFPLFTANGRESMPFTTYGFHDLCFEVYEKTRSIFYVILIMLPVRLRIYIGEPLYCEKDESPAEFAERVGKAVGKLRDTHQRKPGSILAAFLERFQS